ncbi:MAG: hypothetical protein WBW71_07820, partial [Bacteroidota bacterium]
ADWCGYQTGTQPTINRDPTNFSTVDANQAESYLDPAIQKCRDNGESVIANNLKIKRDACPAHYEDECVRGYDALWMNPPPEWVTKSAEAEQCDAVPAGTDSNCACRNKFAKEAGDTTSTANFINGSTAGLVSGLKTLIPGLINDVSTCHTQGKSNCDVELVAARTCCALVNGTDCGV